MDRRPVPYDYRLSDTLAKLSRPGLLLVGSKKDGNANVMTIGWGTVGIIWGKPMFVVLVRPSRYTYEFIEDSQAFTVNVPTDDMTRWVGVCGSVSGRSVDKFQEYGMQATPCKDVPSVSIDVCPMVYACRVVHHNDIIPAHLDDVIEASSYGGNDYHRVYFGEIKGTYATDGY